MYSKCIKTLNFTPCHKLRSSIELKKSYMEQFISFNYGVSLFSFEVKKETFHLPEITSDQKCFLSEKYQRQYYQENFLFNPKLISMENYFSKLSRIKLFKYFKLVLKILSKIKYQINDYSNIR